MLWEYRGYEIDEGMKPRDANYKEDSYQYFFIVKKGGERKFKFCIWANKEALRNDPEIAEESKVTGHKIPEFIYRMAHARVREKIDREDFENCLLEYGEKGLNELPLDELDDKKV